MGHEHVAIKLQKCLIIKVVS